MHSVNSAVMVRRLLQGDCHLTNAKTANEIRNFFSDEPYELYNPCPSVLR